MDGVLLRDVLLRSSLREVTCLEARYILLTCDGVGGGLAVALQG